MIVTMLINSLLRTIHCVYMRHPLGSPPFSQSLSHTQMLQGRCLSSAILLCFAILMTTSVVPHAAAAALKVVESKDKAIAMCNNEPPQYRDLSSAVYRDGPKGNDIFYKCKDNTEKRSTFNRSKECDPKSFGQPKAPIAHHVYKCNEDGRLVLEQCALVPSMTAFAPSCTRIPGYN